MAKGHGKNFTTQHIHIKGSHSSWTTRNAKKDIAKFSEENHKRYVDSHKEIKRLWKELLWLLFN